MLVLKILYRSIFEIADASTKCHPDMSDYYLVRSAWPVFLMAGAYMLFVQKLGPWMMANRPPFELKSFILVYNVFQVLINLYMVILGTCFIFGLAEDGLACTSVIPKDSPNKWIEVQGSYLYYMIKLLDFMDTILFILRKSFNQVSYLHVYHHVLMALGSFYYVRFYGPGGQQAFVGWINGIVHVFMYGYYFASALSPAVKNSVWKQRMTILQIVQFVLIVIQQTYPFIFRPNCVFNRGFALATIIQAFYMLGMFGDFYVKAYRRGNRAQQRHVATD